MYEAERLRLLAEAQEAARATRASGGQPPQPPPPPPPPSPAPAPPPPAPEPQPTGEQLRDEAMQRAEEHAQEEWKEDAARALRIVAARQDEITTDDVWAELDAMAGKTHERRAMGPVMVQAAKDGLIRASDPERYRKSDRPVCHRGPKRIWEVRGG